VNNRRPLAVVKYVVEEVIVLVLGCSGGRARLDDVADGNLVGSQ
jgi:hypothetical protein